MDDPSALILSVEDGSAQCIAGAILLALVAMARSHLEPRLKEGPARDWVSAAAPVAGAVGIALLAGVAWWQALLLAMLAAPTSSGLWRLIAGGSR